MYPAFVTRRVMALCALASCIYSLSLAADLTEEGPEIRAFDLDTLGALGVEIYRHDQLAWKATDAVMEKVGQVALAKEGTVGWVVDVSGKYPLVRFLRDRDGALEAAYDISFKKKPKVSVPKNRGLTLGQLKSHLASRSAIRALREGGLPWCGGNPNFVVLPDPDGVGYLVYVLRPKGSMDEVPVGGHYRITVSADGETVEQVDRLFVSCLTLSLNPPGMPEGASLAALAMSHLVSDLPLETHVFLSLQEGLPFSVVTPDDRLWSIADGVISEM